MSDDLPQPPEMLTSGCMCGAVRYSIAEKPIASGLCNCNRCRPQSGKRVCRFPAREFNRAGPVQADLCQDFFYRAVALELSFLEAAYTDRN
jgi:hypothetical protein